MLFEIMDKQEETSNGSNSRTLAVRPTERNAGLSTLNLLDEKQLAAAEVFIRRIPAVERGCAMGATSLGSGATFAPDFAPALGAELPASARFCWKR